MPQSESRLDEATVDGAAEAAASPVSWCREHFIPLRRHALLQALAAQDDLQPSERRQLRQLSHILDATMHHQLHRHLQNILTAYAPFDPDDDTRDLEAYTPAEKVRLRAELFSTFQYVLERANYVRLTQIEIEQAVGASSDWGVRLHVDFSVFDRLEVYARGDVIDRRKRRTWRTWFREEEVDVPIYQRLVVIFHLNQHPSLDPEVDTTAVYLKLFKNIPKIDVDMLLPGSRICMTLLDRGKIFLPTVSGAAVTIAKIIKGALWAALTGTFWGLVAFLGVIVGMIGYGVRSFFGYLRTKDKYQLNLTRNLYYQNLDNNAGVFHRMLDEAEDQELREVLIAYYLLWKRAPREGWTEAELDDAAEAFLRELLQRDIDFESSDAVQKLIRFGLAELQEDGRLRALSPRQALERLDAAWDSIFSPA